MNREVALYPDVRFEPTFAARAQAAAARLLRRRATSESAGRAWAIGSGEDLAGTRAYRAGDDPRAIDWSASARSDAPIVRILRRPRGGTEVVALDASLSMAIGPPGKLQRAAELAAVLALVASRGGAKVAVLAQPANLRFDLGAAAQFPALLRWLAALRATGSVDWDAPLIPACDRATWIGDLAGAAPGRVARAAPRGSALRVVQILAPHEIEPELDGPVVLLEPEHGERLAVEPGAVVAHAVELERRHAAVCRELARRGARLVRASSAEPVEAVCARLPVP